MEKEKLSRKDWVAAGIRALNKGGPQALVVETIARQLNVSKGSFYWHFKNASDLKQAMLSHWIESATTGVIEDVENNNLDGAEKLYKLVQIATKRPKNQRRDDRWDEAAIRDWARYDSDVANVIVIVDKKRLDFIVRGFKQAGFGRAEANLKAKALYASLIGLEHLTRHGLASIEKDLAKLLAILLTVR
jgi:AcrR family transcriptional regulator